MNNLATTIEEISNAAALTEKWMLKHISDENLYTSRHHDPVSYYKWPLTLISRHKKDEAFRLLTWINEQCLAENGDYVSNRSGFHKEFHHYSTLWIVLAAIKLEDSSLTKKLLGFVLKYHNDVTGGLATFPAEKNNITEDPVSTAFSGMVACDLEDKNLADNILHYFETLLSLQDEEGKFWLRIKTGGSLIKTFPSEVDPETYCITIGEENECYYFLGAACFFIARYIETFDNGPLSLAYKFADVLENCGSKALSTIWAAKVAPGCAGLYSITSDKRFFDIAYPVIRTVLNLQSPEGYWLKNDKPWITVSAEQCFWQTDICKRFQQ